MDADVCAFAQLRTGFHGSQSRSPRKYNRAGAAAQFPNFEFGRLETRRVSGRAGREAGSGWAGRSASVTPPNHTSAPSRVQVQVNKGYKKCRMQWVSVPVHHVFIGATNDSRFRAFDSKTGKLLWETKLEASGHSSPITYTGRDGRQYVAMMAAGGGAFLGGGLSNTLVAFALPDVPRKPLPASVTKAVTAAAAARRGQPQVGTFAPVALPAGGAKALVEKTCGTGCHSIEVVTSQRMNAKDWDAIVQNMVARGAQASDADVKTIVDYLTKTLGR